MSFRSCAGARLRPDGVKRFVEFPPCVEKSALLNSSAMVIVLNNHIAEQGLSLLIIDLSIKIAATAAMKPEE